MVRAPRARPGPLAHDPDEPGCPPEAMVVDSSSSEAEVVEIEVPDDHVAQVFAELERARVDWADGDVGFSPDFVSFCGEGFPSMPGR
eukprot:11186062-Lingulodinium_polyedra.AAC.1